jgi:hypothetical protein
MLGIIRKAFFLLLLIFNCWTLAIAAESVEDSTGREETQGYHVYGNINLVSFMKFQYAVKPKIFVKYVYPQLEVDSESIPRTPAMDNFNQQVRNLIQQEISQFKSLAKPGRKNTLYIDYNTSIIQAHHDYLISLRFSLLQSIAGMAHPFHYHRVINFNLTQNQPITLSSLFGPNANYLDLLSEYSRSLLYRRLSDHELVARGTEPNPANFKVWNIKSNGLLITFDQYQVAPFSNGTQTILVPFAVLKSIITATSPIAVCIAQRRECARTNLLTGGFIDEAAVTPPPHPAHPLLT